MTRKNVEVLIAFDSARPGERVGVLCKNESSPTIGHVIEKSPVGYYDVGWCIKLKPEKIDAPSMEKEGFVEIFRERIVSFKFLREEADMQLSLPFEEDQLPLGI